LNDVTINQIHQIEYRWHPRNDLSPAVSSMSRDPMMRWDAHIRNWVRHPGADGPSESVRYQTMPGDVAALAWRYRDFKVTEGDGRGRPLVSRVLVGAASALSPEMAVLLCRSGLPAAAGPRPDEAEPSAGLPVISAADLAAVAQATVGGLDQEAAWQEDLQPVLAAAFADPDTPLAVGIREPQICQPPAQGIQVLLLWGLWRISSELLGAGRRKWSFSTFEQPVGFADPKSLPDIVFRSAQAAQSVAPAMPRDELKVFPGLAVAPVSNPVYDELAGWLAAEYRELGGDRLQGRIADLIDGTAEDSRLLIVHGRLHATWASPPPIPVQPEPEPALPAPGGEPPLEAPGPQPAQPEPLEGTDAPEAEKPESEEVVPASYLAELIDQLAVTRDAEQFAVLLEETVAAPPLSDEADRRRARAAFGDNNCLVPVFRRHRYAPDEYTLTRIVSLAVLPDLGQPQVRAEIAAWSGRGETDVVAALLNAARYAGADVLSDMKEILQPVLAEMWLNDRKLLAYWRPGPARL
jgi:hypothetical protein